MKKLIVSFVLFMSLALPVVAQDVTIEPTVEFITVVPSEEPTVAVTEEPTAPPVETPVDETPGIDESQIPDQVWNVLAAAVVGIITVAFGGIVGIYLAMNGTLRAIVLSVAKTGVSEFEKKAGTTESKVDDVIAAELRKMLQRLEELEAAQLFTDKRVNQNAAAIQVVQQSVPPQVG